MNVLPTTQLAADEAHLVDVVSVDTRSLVHIPDAKSLAGAAQLAVHLPSLGSWDGVIISGD